MAPNPQTQQRLLRQWLCWGWWQLSPATFQRGELRRSIRWWRCDTSEDYGNPASGFAVRIPYVVEESRLHYGRSCDSGSWHRREYSDVQRDQLRAVQLTAFPRFQSRDGGVEDYVERRSECLFHPCLFRDSSASGLPRSSRCLLERRQEPWRRSRRHRDERGS